MVPGGQRLPGMTETSLLPMAVEAAGLDAVEVYAGIVTRALTTHPAS